MFSRKLQVFNEAVKPHSLGRVKGVITLHIRVQLSCYNVDFA
jgi:hypothetical protein